jgi:hypothetical protein
MRDWKPCVRDLLERLIAAGFVISEIDDGEETIKFTTLDAAVDTITSVDESTVWTTATDKSDPVLFIVLGNGPEEIVADYCGGGPRLCMILEGFSKDWEGKEV